MKRPCHFLILLFLSVSCEQKESYRIIFGSCSHEYDEDQMWEEINAESPDLFVWTGDIIYGDTSDMNVLKQKYDLQKSRTGYQKLISNIPVLGIWDDHDYGVNDGGKHFKQKRESKEIFLDFLDYPIDHPVRDHEGTYHNEIIGEGLNTINLVFLDTRYFRDTLAADTLSDHRYLINADGDVLGTAQWDWLEKVLLQSTSKINVLISGIQVLSNEQMFEKWGNFPKARNRLLSLVEHATVPTIIVSGDRHIGELSMWDSENSDFPIFDFTSSGLTHTWEQRWDDPNPYRIGELIMEKNYGLVTFDFKGEKPEVLFEIKGKENELFYSYGHTFD